ncbi:HAD-IIIA family hydrolase [Coraliomargarita sp. SDUM461004]|uniref:D,D-heptose 1,7-bisphosphate phosphatase n=1 Tax=Thalassobacterium sedimentorum TaxID=3041258 RepID=A0ABU1ANH0_9BACT|nr:HAD-IIIA family hydrolase [Coraliomargarita sp. SDUM461004]MDQ8195158.1 HAD-IIIA family hydrolase [Coraliomargarita sp. SDUM461004]
MDNVWLNPHYAASTATPAIFADRDGTLIRHVDYIDDPAKLELLPGVRESVHRLLDANIPFFILTNQSGVGRGYFPIEQVHACQNKLFEQLAIEPSDIAGWCIAPEAPGTEGGYRKPSPRFIQEACAHLQLPPRQCHMIGDTRVDLETAWQAGAHAWAVACGKPQLPQQIAAGEITGPHTLCKDFPACIDAILSA